jgi:hypothetical protein
MTTDGVCHHIIYIMSVEWTKLMKFDCFLNIAIQFHNVCICFLYRPIVFSIVGDSSYEANFVLATLADVPASQASQSQQRVQSTSKSQR